MDSIYLLVIILLAYHYAFKPCSLSISSLVFVFRDKAWMPFFNSSLSRS